nr:hypothetical protein B0A51_13511 [Rachicladosporium sp. CCFEE 5018]
MPVMFTQPYNRYFKRPDGYSKPRRSPTPPRAYVEPLSPGPFKPQALEPSFNYPALNHDLGFTVRPQPPPQSQYERSYHADSSEHAQVPKRRHNRVVSSIDTLAEAALAVSPDFAVPAARPSHLNRHSHAHPARQTQESEPPHKRSRSELLPSLQVGQYASRPATSYESQYGAASYQSRVEEAALLLNFKTGGWPAAAQSSVLTQNAPAPSRPHANSFPQGAHTQRPAESIHTSAALLTPFFAHPSQSWTSYHHSLPSPQQTSNGPSPRARYGHAPEPPRKQPRPAEIVWKVPQTQMQTPPEDFASRSASSDAPITASSQKRRGWPKGKPRANAAKPKVERVSKRAMKAASKAVGTNGRSVFAEAADEMQHTRHRRSSLSASMTPSASDVREDTPTSSRAQSVPPEVSMLIREMAFKKPARKSAKQKPETICASCNSSRETAGLAAELDNWISCNGCKNWYHVDCAGFKKAHEVRDVDKFFCTDCEAEHGKTTYVRKSTRAHTSVDYAALEKGSLKTSEDSNEHHYIQPIKDGTFKFDPETFPRMRPELITRDLMERSDAFTEPICIPAEWNPRPWELRDRAKQDEDKAVSDDGDCNMLGADDFEYDTVPDDGQDKLDMIMPENLTIRQVCNLVGPDTPLDVIDVKTQNSGGSKWNLQKWTDYYEEESEDKAIRNVISLEVSHTKLGRLLRRPKVVRDIDLQDEVWPQEEKDKGKFPKVQYYCLMSIADSYTDFHIDFGGSSVYYHILRGKKTFLFIPPKAKHLKAYEEWNENPQQNYTFLPHITGECYRVDLNAGDTMLIPSGWIHAVWTPETSLVIGGNFLTRMSFKNQFRVHDIEKNNETPQKFRYPHFQRIMWYTAIRYLEDDPIPQTVSQDFYEGKRFQRERHLWEDFDGDLAMSDLLEGAQNARYYSQAEIDGLPELLNFVFRTVMLTMGRIEGVSQDKMKRVNASIPKGYGEPLEIARSFALWVAWKRGNEDPPAWAHPDAVLPNSKEDGAPKKMSARALKEMERKEAIAAWKVAGPDRQSRRMQNKRAKSPGPALPDPTHLSVTSTKRADATPAKSSFISSSPSQPRALSPPPHQPSSQMAAQTYAPASSMMLGALSGQFVSTPKTSVLGPKRVACDTCRKRRIRCKHKDLVVQAPMPTTYEQSFLSNGDGHYQFVGHGQVALEVGDPITVSPHRAVQQAQMLPNVGIHHQETNADYQFKTPNGVKSNGIPNSYADRVANPGSDANTYLSAGLPIALNNASMYGDSSKRGRSKACYECRKSKRRCIHDDTGNVDPVKAAENPVPRGSGSKKRESESSSPRESVKRLKFDHEISAPHPPPLGMQGILKPVLQPAEPKQEVTLPRAPADVYHNVPGQFWQPDTVHSDHEQSVHSHHSPHEIDGMSRSSGTPIDPSLFSMYPEDESIPQSFSTPYTAPDYTNADRSALYALPSLEQIATEVLDMDGHGGDDAGLSAIQAFNLQQRDDQAQDSQAPSPDTNNDETKPDGSVDSGISMSAHVEHEFAAIPTTESERPATTQTVLDEDRRFSFSTIPFYQPPLPFESPELSRATPRRESRASLYSMFHVSPKQWLSRGASQPLEEDDEELRRALRDDDARS